MAENSDAKRALDAFNVSFYGNGGLEGGNFVGSGEGKFKAPLDYGIHHRNYHDKVFEPYARQYGYADLYLLNAEDGAIVYSVAKRDDFGKIPGKGSGLWNIWQKVVKSRNPQLSDMQPYAAAGNAPAQFVGAPMLKNNEIVGVVAVQFSNSGLIEIMNTRDGMGVSGETYLVGTDLLMRSDSYHDPEHHSLVSSFSSPSTGKVETSAVQNALKGNSGEGIINNYLGTSVLSAYCPVKVGDLFWVLAAEIGEAEALAPVRSLQWTIVVVGVVGLIAIFIFALLAARTLTKPILAGVSFAKVMAGGDLTQHLESKQKDEIGVLVQSLNEMSGNLRQMVSGISNELNVLTSSSAELSAISSQMATDAEQTSSKSNSVASAAEEMSTSMNTVAVSSEKASTNVQMVATAAEQMSATIEEIAQNTEKRARDYQSGCGKRSIGLRKSR